MGNTWNGYTNMGYRNTMNTMPMTRSSMMTSPMTYAAPMNTYAAPAPVGHAFSYNDGMSARTENSHMGVTKGSYSYIDGNGKIQTVNYQADANGFKVDGTNLPIMKMAQPMPVDDTPAVKAAKAKFMAAFKKEEMKSDMPMMKMAKPMFIEDTLEVKQAKAKFMAAFKKEEMRNRNKRGLVWAGLSHTPASTAPLFRAAPLVATTPFYGSHLGLGLLRKKRALMLGYTPASTAPLFRAAPLVATTPFYGSHLGLGLLRKKRALVLGGLSHTPASTAPLFRAVRPFGLRYAQWF